MKTCLECNIEKPLEEFYKRPKGKYYASYCWPCHRSKALRYYHRNVDAISVGRSGFDFNWKAKWYTRKRKYGITEQEYYDLCEDQDQKCAICGVERMYSLDIDHDPNTGKMRGLLCGNCNRGIGMLKHNIDFLTNAIRYLSAV